MYHLFFFILEIRNQKKKNVELQPNRSIWFDLLLIKIILIYNNDDVNFVPPSIIISIEK